MTEAEAEQLLESIARHFLAGCGFMDAAQFRSHKATGACPQCTARGELAAAAAKLGMVSLMAADAEQHYDDRGRPVIEDD